MEIYKGVFNCNSWIIYNMDCNRALNQYIEQKSIDCIITSPPYGQQRAYGSTGKDEGNKAKYIYSNKGEALTNEIGYGETIKQYFISLQHVFNGCYNVLKSKGFFAVNINKWREEKQTIDISRDLIEIAKKAGFTHRETIIWLKDNPRSKAGISAGEYYLDDAWEYILLFSKGNAKIDRDKYKKILIKMKCDKCGNYMIREKTSDPNILYPNYLETNQGYLEDSYLKSEHPAKFPKKIPKFIMKITSEKGDRILDPFSGIGSTLVAGLEENRNVIGCELKEEFCKKAIIEIKNA